MSKKTVYGLFENKRQLLKELAFDADRFSRALVLAEPLPPLEALREGLRLSILFALSPRQLLATRILISAGGSEMALAADFHDAVITQAQERHAELLTALAAASDRRIDESLLMAKQLFGLAMGDLHILALIGIHTPDVERKLETQLDSAMSFAMARLMQLEQL